MKRRWLLTALGAILAGAGLHFLWQALPNPLFALISPVNESCLLYTSPSPRDRG